MAQVELTVRTLARSGWVVAGLLLLAIGVGDLVVGRTKLAQYHVVLEQTPAVRTHDRAVLFPKVTEADGQVHLYAENGVASRFGVYVTHLSNFNHVYGSLAAPVALLFFVYLAAMTMLWCAELASWSDRRASGTSAQGP